MDHHQHPAPRAGLAAPEHAHQDHRCLPSLGAATLADAELTPPHKDEDHRLAGAVVFKAEIKADGPDCASADQVLQPPADKAFATLQARLALAGWTLTQAEQEGGPVSFLASRWNRARELPNLAAVATFADQVGAPS